MLPDPLHVHLDASIFDIEFATLAFSISPESLATALRWGGGGGVVLKNVWVGVGVCF